MHPRADARHITFADVRDIAGELEPLAAKVEFNIEGDPRPDLLALAEEVRSRSVHAGAGACRRNHQSGGMGSGTPILPGCARSFVA